MSTTWAPTDTHRFIKGFQGVGKGKVRNVWSPEIGEFRDVHLLSLE
jgi:hypothetical protein